MTGRTTRSLTNFSSPNVSAEVRIRGAATTDHEEWRRMRLALWPDCSSERHELEMKELTGPKAEGVVLVAETVQGLSGFAEISVRHDHVEGSAAVPVPYLEGWYVDSEDRGHGIGKKLLKHAEQWAIEHGYSELASDAEIQNETSIATHLSCGFHETARTVHFIKRLR